MENGEENIDENLATIQETVEVAAVEVAHHTNAEREKYTKHAGECQIM